MSEGTRQMVENSKPKKQFCFIFHKFCQTQQYQQFPPTQKKWHFSSTNFVSICTHMISHLQILFNLRWSRRSTKERSKLYNVECLQIRYLDFSQTAYTVTIHISIFCSIPRLYSRRTHKNSFVRKIMLFNKLDQFLFSVQICRCTDRM